MVDHPDQDEALTSGDGASVAPRSGPIPSAIGPERPNDPLVINAAASSHGNLAGALVLLGRFDEAAAEYREEIGPREALVRDHPRVLLYRLSLASVYTNLGELDMKQVLAVEPRHEVTRYSLSYTFGWRARALEAIGRPREVIAAWDRAIAYDDRGDPELRANREKASALLKHQ